MNKLKLCPLCGGEAKLFTQRNQYEPNGCYVTHVSCSKCNHSTQKYGVLNKESTLAVKEWNG
jgi:hypothetical protein